METVSPGDPRATHWTCPECYYAVEVSPDRVGPLFCDDHRVVTDPGEHGVQMELAILSPSEAEFVVITGSWT